MVNLVTAVNHSMLFWTLPIHRQYFCLRQRCQDALFRKFPPAQTTVELQRPEELKEVGDLTYLREISEHVGWI